MARLHVDVWRATYRDYATHEALELLDEARRLPYWTAAIASERAEAGVLVAEQAESVPGVISFGPADQDVFGGRIEIKHLYVAEEAQGRGVAAALICPLLARFEARGVALAVVAQNARARRF